MTDTQIMKAIIKRVRPNGLDCELSGTGKTVNIFREGSYKASLSPTIGEFIFRHDFAKAFFGEELIWNVPMGGDAGGSGGNVGKIPAYKYYFQQLALTPDNERLAYLAQFLEEHE